MKKIFSLLSLVLILSSCTSTQPRSSQPSAPAAISSEESRVGDEIHYAITSTFRAYTEPRTVHYVNQVAQALAKSAERKDLPYEVTILYHDKIYATSAPGGHIYITTGMIHFLQNEAELAAVLAHEIGELQFKDPRLSQSKKILDTITKGGAMVAPALGEIGALAVLGLAMVNALAESQQISPQERLFLADQKAFHFMVQAGYDPQGIPDVLYRFLNADPYLRPYFFDYSQSRPITPERIAAARHAFSILPLQGKTLSTRQKEFLEMTKGIREIYHT